MMMRQKSIALEPAELRALGSAYDDVWRVLAREIGTSNARSVERARTKLAFIMLELARFDQLSADQIRQSGIRIFREIAIQVEVN